MQRLEQLGLECGQEVEVRTTVGGRWSMVSGQWSVVNGHWLVVLVVNDHDVRCWMGAVE